MGTLGTAAYVSVPLLPLFANTVAENPNYGHSFPMTSVTGHVILSSGFRHEISRIDGRKSLNLVVALHL